jgi:uncharacterized protein
MCLIFMIVMLCRLVRSSATSAKALDCEAKAKSEASGSVCADKPSDRVSVKTSYGIPAMCHET